jgi:hypothetical protein
VVTRRRGDAETRGQQQTGSLRDEFLAVLTDVAHQVLRGKGEERHGRGRPFEEQPTFKILDLVGPGYAAGQAIKKIEEAKGLLEITPGGAYCVTMSDRDAAVDAELLGAIGYLAMLVVWRRSRA